MFSPLGPQQLAIGTDRVLNSGRNAPEAPEFRSSHTRQECRRTQRRRVVGLTGFRGERAPAAVAVEEDVVAELLVLLRRPQALAVVGLGFVARLAPHCRRMPPPRARRAGEAAGEQSREGQSGGRSATGEGASATRL
jgi:hypothetical protein